MYQPRKISYSGIIPTFLVLVVFFISTDTAYAAIAVDKSSYTYGETIVLTTDGQPYQIYDLTAGNSQGGAGAFSAGEPVSFDYINNHQYALVEINQDGGCQDANFSYTQCKASAMFLSETTFTIGTIPSSSPTPSPSSDSGGTSAASGAIKSYRPEVEIFSPKFLQVSSSTVFISYKATDLNDKDSTSTREWLGMPENPVTIFYSPDSDVRKRKLIAKDLPAIGSFSWDSIGLKDSDTYFIIVSATDKVGDTGEAQVGQFTIDHSVPLFTVKTDPTQTKGEDVAISIESSKELVGLPVVNVIQSNFIPTLVEITGSKKSFKGVYKVVSGYDGLATISVSGTDKLNNISTKIVSGGEFSVGLIVLPKSEIDIAKAKEEVTGINVIKTKPKPVQPFSVKLLYPREDRGVGGVAEIVWEADSDHIGKVKSVNLSYRKGTEPYRSIASGTINPKILWDVRDLEEGNDYEIKLEASDGQNTSEVVRKVFVDNTSPTIEVKARSSESSSTEFSLEATGQAADKFSGVDFVEYSLDGEHWFKADMKSGALKNKTDFSIKYPYKLEDGPSEVKYRAVDGAGNLSKPVISRIVLDANPPRVGSYTISKKEIMLLPSDEQKFEVISEEILRFRISMEEDTVNATIRIGDLDFPLSKGSDNLWMTDIKFSKLGLFNIFISASDRGDHSYSNKKIGRIQVKERGTIAEGAVISIYVLDENEKRYVRWQAEEFGELNPFITDMDGGYKLLLPKGKYYLKIQKEGYEKIRSEKFEVKTPTYINLNFNLKKLEGIRGVIEPIVDKFMFYEN
jgi:hypothetical protein